MMQYRNIHALEGLNFGEMTAIQKNLRAEISDTPLAKEPRFVSGVDIGYDSARKKGVAVIVTLDYQSRQVVDTTYAVGDAPLPYRPGYLAFRELPLFLKAWEKLETETDLLFFDGQGRIHPRRMGLATHAGFFIDKPTVGIAKNPFVGTFDTPQNVLGSYRYVHDKAERIGAVLRTKVDTKPVFVSAGNRITLEDALRMTLHFVDGKYRIPMPTRLADSQTKKLRPEMG
jgi:deoxyribonuclease V